MSQSCQELIGIYERVGKGFATGGLDIPTIKAIQVRCSSTLLLTMPCHARVTRSSVALCESASCCGHCWSVTDVWVHTDVRSRWYAVSACSPGSLVYKATRRPGPAGACTASRYPLPKCRHLEPHLHSALPKQPPSHSYATLAFRQHAYVDAFDPVQLRAISAAAAEALGAAAGSSPGGCPYGGGSSSSHHPRHVGAPARGHQGTLKQAACRWLADADAFQEHCMSL